MMENVIDFSRFSVKSKKKRTIHQQGTVGGRTNSGSINQYTRSSHNMIDDQLDDAITSYGLDDTSIASAQHCNSTHHVNRMVGVDNLFRCIFILLSFQTDFI